MADTKQYFNLNYESRDDDTNDTLIDLSMRFENPSSDEEIAKKLNTWLKAIDVKLEVVKK